LPPGKENEYSNHPSVPVVKIIHYSSCRRTWIEKEKDNASKNKMILDYLTRLVVSLLEFSSTDFSY
jgi:hypothetical protein